MRLFPTLTKLLRRTRVLARRSGNNTILPGDDFVVPPYTVTNGHADFMMSAYFSWPFICLGVVSLVVAIPVMNANTIAGLVMCLVSLAIFTTHYRLRIDLSNKLAHDYLWILGFKNGNLIKFETLEYLFIKKNRISQQMNHIVASSTIRNEVYDGYLKLSGQNVIHLATQKNKTALLKKLTRISAVLNLRIIDYSDGTGVDHRTSELLPE